MKQKRERIKGNKISSGVWLGFLIWGIGLLNTNILNAQPVADRKIF